MVTAVVPNVDALNVGPHWDAKLARLADWQIPVVIFEADAIANATDLPTDITNLTPLKPSISGSDVGSDLPLRP